MERKKLVVLLGGFSVGGAEHMVYELVKSVDQRNYDIHVLCYASKTHTELERQVECVCPVTYLNETGSITPGAIWNVICTLRRMKPDVVHAHMGGAGFGAIWSLLFRGRLVVTAHTKPEKAFSPKIEKLVRLALKTSKTTLVAVSQENGALLKAYFGMDEKQLAVVNNGIDLDRFYRKAHEGFALINVARHDENKNQAALIRCFARLYKEYPQVKLLLLGDGPTHEALMAQVKGLGLENAVTFTGNVPNTQDYYGISDLYVQCSHREAMPLSVLEAMAAGLPVVSTNVGGLSDVVQDNGILVADHDEEALYRAIEKVLNQSPEQMTAMCRASERIVQSYSSQGMARAYEAIYQQMSKGV